MMNEKYLSNDQGRNDWRVDLSLNERLKIFCRLHKVIRDRYIAIVPSENERICGIGLKLEQQEFENATSKVDYINRLSWKVVQIQNIEESTIRSWFFSVGLPCSSIGQGLPLPQPNQKQLMLENHSKQIMVQPFLTSDHHQNQWLLPPPESEHVNQCQNFQPAQQQWNSTTNLFQQYQPFWPPSNIVLDHKQKSVMTTSDTPNLSLLRPLSSVRMPQSMSHFLTSLPIQNSKNSLNSSQLERQTRLQPSQFYEAPGFPKRIESFQAQEFVNHQRPLHPQNLLLPGALTEPRSLIENEIVDDWRDLAYQEVEFLRLKCLLELKILYESYSMNIETRLCDKLKDEMCLIDKLLNFLCIKRNDLDHYSKEEFNYYKQAIFHVHSNIQERCNYVPPIDVQTQNSFGQQMTNPTPNPPQMINLVAFGNSTIDISSPSSMVQEEIASSSQQNVNISPQYGHQTILGTSNASLVLGDIATSPQQMIFSNETSMNRNDSTINSVGMNFLPPVPHRKRSYRKRKSGSFQPDQPQGTQKKKQWIPRKKNNESQQNSPNRHLKVSHKLPECSSPATLLAPLPISVDYDKHCFDHVLEVSNSEDIQNLELESPFERLLKAVDMISPSTLNVAVDEISLFFKMVDETPEEPIEADIMNHKITTTLVSSSPKDDTMLITMSEKKIELLDEIKSINQRLMETRLDLDSSEEGGVTTEGGEQNIVRCTYSTECLRGISNSNNLSHIFPILQLYLLVPANYPNVSPKVLNSSTVGQSEYSEDFKMKADVKFSIALCMLSEPMSLEDITRAWDTSAREVFTDYAQSLGGGSFSPEYGSWENGFNSP